MTLRCARCKKEITRKDDVLFFRNYTGTYSEILWNISLSHKSCCEKDMADKTKRGMMKFLGYGSNNYTSIPDKKWLDSHKRAHYAMIVLIMALVLT